MSRKGVPNFAPTQEQREQVEMLAAIGIPHEHIAMIVKNGAAPISVDTLTRHFPDELALGLSKASSLVAGQLMKTALGRNAKATGADELRAQMFWLNTRGGFATTSRDVGDAEDEGVDETAIAARVVGLVEKGLRQSKAKPTAH